MRQQPTVGIPWQSQGTRKLSASPSQPIQRRNTGKERSFCSEQTIENLITPLLRNLPSYTNRASQRARRLRRKTDVYSYMVLAGKPDFTPLPFNPGVNTTDAAKSSDEKVEQVFFYYFRAAVHKWASGAIARIPLAVFNEKQHWLADGNDVFANRFVSSYQKSANTPTQ
jgi:hypothetical protein